MPVITMFIRKDALPAVFSALFLVLSLSGCDDKSPTVDLFATAPQTTNGPCQREPEFIIDQNNGRYPLWPQSDGAENINYRTNELAKIEKDQGKTLKYYSLAIVIQANKTTQLLSEESFIPQEAQLQATALYSLIAAAQECYKAAPPSSSTQLTRYSFMLDAANEYSRFVEERIQRHWDKTPYSQSEKTQIGGMSEWMVKGSAGKVIRAYNKVIDDFNQLIH